MQKIKRRYDQQEIIEKYMRIVTDYAHGITIEEIMKRNSLKSPQTIYVAIDRINKEMENGKNLEKGKNVSKRKS